MFLLFHKKEPDMSSGSSLLEHAPTIIPEVSSTTGKYTVSKPDKKLPMANRAKRIASPTPQVVASTSLSEATGEIR